MTGQNHMPEVVNGHVSIYAIIGELVRHDPSSRIEDHDVNSVNLASNFLRSFGNSLPVSNVTLHPRQLLCSFRAQVFRDGLRSTIGYFLRKGQDEDLADVVGKERMCAAIADAF